MGYRVLERIDPRMVYGRPWYLLNWDEQNDLMGYERLRQIEESPPPSK